MWIGFDLEMKKFSLLYMSRNRFKFAIAVAFLLAPLCSIRLSADNATNSPNNNPAIAPDANYIHSFTGFTFPPKVDAFRRS